MRTLNIAEIDVIERAKSAVGDLLKLADPRGPLAECRTRSRIRRTAKYLMIDICKLVDEPTQAAIADSSGREP